MAALRLFSLLALLLAAPALAQVRTPHHSAGESCQAPAEPAPTANAPARPEPQRTDAAPPPANGTNGCAHCDPRYRMPPRWHSFLPGMYR